MSRVFAYCRVSTAEQVTANQRQEIEAAGFVLERHRIIEECISGSVTSSERPGFLRLLDRLEPGDVLVVTKLDRLGRNAMDVRATVERLETHQVRVHCLALGGVDLASAAGKMTMQVIAAVAEFERDLLIERTQSGLRRARAQGKRLGRPSRLNGEQRTRVLQRLAAGTTVAQVAKEFATSRQTILRVRRGGPRRLDRDRDLVSEIFWLKILEREGAEDDQKKETQSLLGLQGEGRSGSREG